MTKEYQKRMFRSAIFYVVEDFSVFDDGGFGRSKRGPGGALDPP